MLPAIQRSLSIAAQLVVLLFWSPLVRCDIKSNWNMHDDFEKERKESEESFKNSTIIAVCCFVGFVIFMFVLGCCLRQYQKRRRAAAVVVVDPDTGETSMTRIPLPNRSFVAATYIEGGGQRHSIASNR